MQVYKGIKLINRTLELSKYKTILELKTQTKINCFTSY